MFCLLYIKAQCISSDSGTSTKHAINKRPADISMVLHKFTSDKLQDMCIHNPLFDLV